MRLRRDKCLRIDAINKEELDRLVRSPKTPAAVFTRARSILLLGQNVGPSEVARRTGLSRVNVYIWAKRFYDCGVAGLHDLPRRRKPRPAFVPIPKPEPGISSSESPLAAMIRQSLARELMYADD